MRSTPSADRVLGRALHEMSPKLARRAVVQGLVRVNRIVMLKPAIKLVKHSCRIRTSADPCIIALERLHKSFGHSIAGFRSAWSVALDRSRGPTHVSRGGCRGSRCPTAIRPAPAIDSLAQTGLPRSG